MLIYICFIIFKFEGIFIESNLFSKKAKYKHLLDTLDAAYLKLLQEQEKANKKGL